MCIIIMCNIELINKKYVYTKNQVNISNHSEKKSDDN